MYTKQNNEKSKRVTKVSTHSSLTHAMQDSQHRSGKTQVNLKDRVSCSKRKLRHMYRSISLKVALEGRLLKASQRKVTRASRAAQPKA